MSIFTESCAKLKIIVSEIDGIITEDLLYIDELGNIPFKKFCKKDFEIINELKKTFTFVFLSTDNSISYHLCRRRNIPFFHAPKNKKESLVKIMQRYSASPEEILYIGCSLSDLECMQMIPFSMCPVDAMNDIKSTAFHVLDNFSGEGILCEIYSLLKDEIKLRKINT
jgi:3-deoxy-D-manno-octulosonate 8-phosphate phosphatase (KDO 8-P phosphatase)